MTIAADARIASKRPYLIGTAVGGGVVHTCRRGTFTWAVTSPAPGRQSDLLPFVPSIVAGAGLAAFSGGLLGTYAKTPGTRKPGTPFPSDQGTALAKDVWIMGVALGLIVDELTDGR